MIPGLSCLENWVSADEETMLLSHIGPGGKRVATTQRNRIERYGPGVPKTGYIEAHRFGLELSPELAMLCDRLADQNLIRPAPDAVTIGWYLPGQSMRPHVDNAKAGEIIAVLALAGSAEMRFCRDGVYELGQAELKVSVQFQRRMLVVMADEVRWMWRHEILPVTEPRISIVFRRAAV